MTILVIAEHDHQSLKAATLNTVAAAQKIGGDIHLLVAGTNCTAAAQQAATLDGVSQGQGRRRRPLPGPDRREPDRPGRRPGRRLQPHPRPGHHLRQEPAAARRRLARRRPDLRHRRRRIPDTFVRPIYAGNALATVQSADKIKVITVRTTAFATVDATGGAAQAKTENIPAGPDTQQTQLQHRELTKSERPELGAAKIIVSGGRGLGSGENYHALLEPLADKLGAALGASRAAVDAGFVPNDYQVGQTGKIVAPSSTSPSASRGRSSTWPG
jgi:electron transfer flavoprotein alpha subunit